MAVLTSDQIIQLLKASGGDLSVLTGEKMKSKLTKSNLLAALAKNPKLLAQVQKQAGIKTKGLNEWDTNFAYNPATRLNDVEMKYVAMGDKYKDFAIKYWEDVRMAGSTSVAQSVVLQDMDNRKAQVLSQYNLSEGEYADITNMFNKDLSAFQKAEGVQEKSQYAAFLTRRKEVGLPDGGVAYSGGDAGDSYIYGATGLRGLATMPKDLNSFIRSKTSRFVNTLSKAGQGAHARMLAPQFEKNLRTRVGKNYQKFAWEDIVKQTIAGKTGE